MLKADSSSVSGPVVTRQRVLGSSVYTKFQTSREPIPDTASLSPPTPMAARGQRACADVDICTGNVVCFAFPVPIVLHLLRTIFEQSTTMILLVYFTTRVLANNADNPMDPTKLYGQGKCAAGSWEILFSAVINSSLIILPDAPFPAHLCTENSRKKKIRARINAPAWYERETKWKLVWSKYESKGRVDTLSPCHSRTRLSARPLTRLSTRYGPVGCSCLLIIYSFIYLHAKFEKRQLQQSYSTQTINHFIQCRISTCHLNMATFLPLPWDLQRARDCVVRTYRASILHSIPKD